MADGISAARYAERMLRAKAAVAQSGASVLLVGVGPELEWLTGYAAHGGERLNLLVIPAEGDMAYVVVHDSGNYFVVDAICTDAPGVPNVDPTAYEAIEQAIEYVEDLVDDGTLNKGNGNSLIKKLEGALQQLDRGNIRPALGKLAAFINEVEAFLKTGKLTEEQAQPLIDLINTAIGKLEAQL